MILTHLSVGATAGIWAGSWSCYSVMWKPRGASSSHLAPSSGTLLGLGHKETDFFWATALCFNRRSHNFSHRKGHALGVILRVNACGQACPSRTPFYAETKPLSPGLCFWVPVGLQSTWDHCRVCVGQASCKRQGAGTPRVSGPPASWWWSEHQEGTNLKTKQCGNCPWSPGCLALEGRCFRLVGPGSDED